jgi:uncharacterized protein YbjT (DUF2867 family)
VVHAVVFGSTGTAGSGVVSAALADHRIAAIRAVTRRPLGIEDAKLREVRCENFEQMDPIADALTGIDACFFCLGISTTQAKSEAHYREITVEYALEAARVILARSPQCTFHYLSGRSTDPTGKSWMMWARVKGEAENKLSAIGFRRLFHHRPAYIHPEDPSFFARGAFSVMSSLSSNLAIRSIDLGRAMIAAQCSDRAGGVLENDELLRLARS